VHISNRPSLIIRQQRDRQRDRQTDRQTESMTSHWHTANIHQQ